MINTKGMELGKLPYLPSLAGAGIPYWNASALVENDVSGIDSFRDYTPSYYGNGNPTGLKAAHKGEADGYVYGMAVDNKSIMRGNVHDDTWETLDCSALPNTFPEYFVIDKNKGILLLSDWTDNNEWWIRFYRVSWTEMSFTEVAQIQLNYDWWEEGSGSIVAALPGGVGIVYPITYPTDPDNRYLQKFVVYNSLTNQVSVLDGPAGPLDETWYGEPGGNYIYLDESIMYADCGNGRVTFWVISWSNAMTGPATYQIFIETQAQTISWLDLGCNMHSPNQAGDWYYDEDEFYLAPDGRGGCYVLSQLWVYSNQSAVRLLHVTPSGATLTASFGNGGYCDPEALCWGPNGCIAKYSIDDDFVFVDAATGTELWRDSQSKYNMINDGNHLDGPTGKIVRIAQDYETSERPYIYPDDWAKNHVVKAGYTDAWGQTWSIGPNLEVSGPSYNRILRMYGTIGTGAFGIGTEVWSGVIDGKDYVGPIVDVLVPGHVYMATTEGWFDENVNIENCHAATMTLEIDGAVYSPYGWNMLSGASTGPISGPILACDHAGQEFLPGCFAARVIFRAGASYTRVRNGDAEGHGGWRDDNAGSEIIKIYDVTSAIELSITRDAPPGTVVTKATDYVQFYVASNSTFFVRIIYGDGTSQEFTHTNANYQYVWVSFQHGAGYVGKTVSKFVIGVYVVNQSVDFYLQSTTFIQYWHSLLYQIQLVDANGTEVAADFTAQANSIEWPYYASRLMEHMLMFMAYGRWEIFYRSNP